MADIASRDQNNIPSLLAVSSVDGTSTVKVYANPTTHRLLVDLPSSSIATETPAGAVNGSNVTYTFTNVPAVIVVDQGRTMKENSGWTRVGLVVTLDVAPTFEIYSMY